MKNAASDDGDALVLGYGNTLRGDDGIGPEVAESVAARQLPGVRVRVVPQLAPELAEDLARARLAIFVDAWIAPTTSGIEVHPLQPNATLPPLGHTSNPASLLALAEVVYGRSPPAWLVRVPAAGFGLGEPLSLLARQGVDAALQEVLRLLETG